MVADLVLAETADDLMLFAPQTFHPVVHALHHFTLYSGVGIVEVWVEATRKLRYEEEHVRRWYVQALENVFSNIANVY